MIELQHIYAGYPGNMVLSDFSLMLPEQGVIAIGGPSGIGKTTLLNVLAGLLQPTAGRISGLAGKKISMVFQKDRLLPWRTALQNVKVVLAKSDADHLATHALMQMELAEAAQLYPRELSGGMQRRVALARALAYESDLLLLDEPFTGLDEALRAHIAQYVKAAAPLIVMVTHDAQDAQALGAQMISLEKQA